MNQIKQKIEEIGLSQREISKRLGKNASYLAGVFRTSLSTAKQAELMDGLDTVANGGTILSDEKLLELVDDQLENANNEIEAGRRKYKMLYDDFQELKRNTANLLDKNRAELSVKQKQLNCANSLADVRGEFLDQYNKERWKYQDKYAYHFKLNFILILVIVIGLISWVVV